MRRALRRAERGWGRVAPNPMVGAVLVREGSVVGEGHHAEYGGEHAEVAALREAGSGARGATLYVTLEPCDHEGNTPPCTEAILEAGVTRVVYACPDPDPAAAGGAERLRRAGVEVRGGVAEAEARRQNAAFFWRHAAAADRAPFTALKLALSADARIAARPGVRSRVTGTEARRRAHRLRAGFEAVLVGRRTAAVDDPELTARGDVRPRRPPIRIVLDPGLRLDPESRLARSAGEAPVWVVAGPGAARERRSRLEERGVRVLDGPAGGSGGLELAAVWRRLAGEGIGSLLVEGGGRVASSLLAAGLPRRLYLFYAPLLFGPEGVPAFPEGPAVARGEWRVAAREALGDDTLVVFERDGLIEELGGRRPGAAGEG